MNNAHLYLLYFPKINAIKIGKANHLQNRIDILTRHWGHVDYQGSYYLKANEKDVLKLEKSLQFLVASFKLEFDYGDGKEEMFKIESLEYIKAHINLYVASSGKDIQIQKGIPEKIVKPVVVKNRNVMDFTAFIKKDKQTITMFNESRLKIIRLHRLVHFLLKHHERIKYQYVYKKDYSFKIAFIKDGVIKKTDAHVLWNLFRHQYGEPGGGFSFNFYCAGMRLSTSTPTIIQLDFLFETFDDDERFYSAGYHIASLIRTIRKLPERSALLGSDILSS